MKIEKKFNLIILIIFWLSFSRVIIGKEIFNRDYNGSYSGSYLNRVAFPIGGIGAGMVCLEGTGALSHISVRNAPDIFNEPLIYAAICVKGENENIAKVIEGPIPQWKYFGKPNSGNGLGGTSYGLPRFENATFTARFPFGKINLTDSSVPLKVNINGWSPFIPGDPDHSSLPVGSLEYHFVNPTDNTQEAVFSFHSENFMHITLPDEWGRSFVKGESIKEFQDGFLLWQDGTEENPHYEGGFTFFTDDENAKINYCWFRGLHSDAMTMNWKNIQSGKIVENPAVAEKTAGASLYVPFVLKPGGEKTIRVLFCWYVPHTNLRRGADLEQECSVDGEKCCPPKTYIPWYAGKYNNIYELAKYWRLHYDDLLEKTTLFTTSFYESTLPGEVLEAVAANLTILKSSTVLRQTDGRLWAWEGCHDDLGCCAGSCTHVWNYAQAIPHLFPSLERTLRETEFYESQTKAGFQKFRASLPIRPAGEGRHAAADGQLGGIMKVYREWRISGDTIWLKNLWPQVKQSMDYCIKTWDPKHKGIVEEPHHNTYDIEFWGPEGMCTGFYLGALTAISKMGEALDQDMSFYRELLNKGKKVIESELFNGEYFIQKVKWKGLQAKDPIELAKGAWNVDYSPEAIEILKIEGPKYQYGNGCMSDGVLGIWIARMCGLDNIIDPDKVKSHLSSVYKYNMRKSLLNHANPQRPSFAMGTDGGLLLCTWPKGGEPTFPFIYSNEVWTGIEYQVASHLILEGMVEEGLDIVRTCRTRYNGIIRNPFNEYECGHWYARAMSSYGLIRALTGIRYDAIDKTLYFDSKIGNDFKCFLSTESGFGTAGLKAGKPFIEIKTGNIEIKQCFVSGKEMEVIMNK
ncbi:hypothetical protein JXQ31_01015 [candidate division KSB1 bacterium]|nr:hypothetical protein [candidate division KSB1 bacterium]